MYHPVVQSRRPVHRSTFGGLMNSRIRSALAVSVALVATQAVAQITFYEGESFRGRAFTAEKQIANFERFGFNDRSSSVIVDRAIVGGIIGGVLGHQIGGGRGKDVATAGGAVAGAAIGANAGREGGDTYSRDVRRCEKVGSGPPAYWDVGYNFRGGEHHVQMSAAPGPTIFVNQNSETRH